MLPWSRELAGRLDECAINSELLRGNPLDDPHERPIWVYTPPGYDARPDVRFPSVYVLQGFLGQVDMWANRLPLQPTFVEAADTLFSDGRTPGVIIVLVDAWTTYGGSQFLDSPGTGRYHSYLCDEVVPWVDRHYRTVAHRDHRGVAGKSSGGYGAMVTPMLRPDLFAALATHAGDALFEYTCFSKFPVCLRQLRAYDGDIQRWWKEFRDRLPALRPGEISLLILLGMAACFSSDPDGTPQLPFDPATGALRPAVWKRWQERDPVRMVRRHRAAVRSLHSIWIDAGTSDEQYLDVGAQAFRAALARAGVDDDVVRFELFPGGHGGLDHRYPRSLEWLAQRLQVPVSRG